MKKLYISLALGAGVIALASACRVSIPKNARAVMPFDQKKYLGTWYEIARLDFKFERNLNNVTANYSLGEQGMIEVVNRGYHVLKNEWKQSIGKAKFLGNPREARLKVSFFGPFYSGYNVIAIDNDYRYALIAGNNLDYLWILSREKTIPVSIKIAYLQKARDLGYQTQKLVWTKHD
jgi:apolipoprotein D and lipocalin family protein